MKLFFVKKRTLYWLVAILLFLIILFIGIPLLV